ncbi:hypothetical protein DSL72_009408 [Monilinia vaccinii-corymbosi]|uniref:Uncharacterized protein n=1 Tax=Monilinia vaccinii-corymbosi TaxID=61207 RepID=A0A8A3PR03_9HELO|nr:hypothetical protein DSL72_009408 [Monilinia vaccinii-corymbosi]
MRSALQNGHSHLQAMNCIFATLPIGTHKLKLQREAAKKSARNLLWFSRELYRYDILYSSGWRPVILDSQSLATPLNPDGLNPQSKTLANRILAYLYTYRTPHRNIGANRIIHPHLTSSQYPLKHLAVSSPQLHVDPSSNRLAPICIAPLGSMGAAAVNFGVCCTPYPVPHAMVWG